MINRGWMITYWLIALATAGATIFLWLDTGKISWITIVYLIAMVILGVRVSSIEEEE